MGNIIVTVALFGWIPAVLGLFCVMPARRAVLVAFLVAWLFLPMAGVKIAEGIPIFNKMNATCAAVLLAAVLFDFKRLASFQFTWVDLPMALWCACPMASSLANDLGPYDGMSAMFTQVVTWGLPYFIGRVYFSDLESLKELAVGILIGGLIYVPLCWIEIRMSPQLHGWVYGIGVGGFGQTVRFGGFRPVVFMQHGLMVGMWMCMSGLIGAWLWYSGAVRKLGRMPTVYAVGALLVTAVMCKSVGAVVLMAAGMGALWLVMSARSQALVWLLILAAPAYMVVRGSGTWDASELVSSAQSTAGADRGQSLGFRVKNENVLAEKARQRPVFGWGGWGRSRLTDKYGKDAAITDGLWIIILGTSGVVGLGAWTAAMLLPVGLFVMRMPAGRWRDADVAGGAVLAVVVVLYVIDCVPNGMVNPIFTLCVGGFGTLAGVGMRAVRGEAAMGGMRVRGMLRGAA